MLYCDYFLNEEISSTREEDSVSLRIAPAPHVVVNPEDVIVRQIAFADMIDKAGVDASASPGGLATRLRGAEPRR